jgi:hypothetical protein
MKTLRCGVAVGVVLSLAGSAEAAGNPLSVTAHLWPYESLCKLGDPPEPVGEYRMEKGTSFTMEGCSDLEIELGTPPAVRLHFANSGTDEAELVIKSLASIAVKGRNAGTALAIQLRHASPLGRGWTSGIAVKLEGEYAPIVLAGGAVDIVVLFKAAAVGDSVVLGDQPPVKIAR